MRPATTLLIAAALLSNHCGGAASSASPGASRPSEAAPALPVPDAAAAWDRLASNLPGAWEATVERGTIQVSYRLVSSDSALVETFRTPSGKETITVYHRDVSHVMLTHYCGQKNQPRLRASAMDEERLRFEWLDATDVGADESVMRVMEVVLRPMHSQGAFDQTTTYRASNGSEETETLHFTRVAPP